MTVQDYLVPQRSKETKTFPVSTSGSTYRFRAPQDEFNPTLTLIRGSTYIFNTSASSRDAFWIKTAQVTGTGSAYNDGVTGNGAFRGTVNGVTTNGVLTFVVPANAPDRLYYISQGTATMTGIINIVDGSIGLPDRDISFSSIQEEYGGANPISLDEYYAGGSYVPTGSSGFRGAVPSSGSISALDLAKIDLLKMFGKQWSASFSIDQAVGGMNSDGQSFFSSVAYDPALSSWIFPSACFNSVGDEIWSMKLKCTSPGTKPTITCSTVNRDGNFVVGGYFDKVTSNDRTIAFLLVMSKTSISSIQDIRIFTIKSNQVADSFRDVQWAFDHTNDIGTKWLLAVTGTNRFQISRHVGYGDTAVDTSGTDDINIYTFTGSFATMNIESVKSFIYVPMKQQLFAVFNVTNYYRGTGAVNKRAYIIIGFDASSGPNKGRIVKYAMEYSSSTTVDYDFLDCVITDYDSEGNLIGDSVFYYNNLEYFNESFEHVKFLNQTLPNFNDQYDISGYRLYAGFEDGNTYAMRNSLWYEPNYPPEQTVRWDQFTQVKRSMVINDDQGNAYPNQGSTTYKDPNSTGHVINISTLLLAPEDITISQITNGRVIGFTGLMHNTNIQVATGLYSWYLTNTDYSALNTHMDLYNYCSAFQQPNNKRRIGIVASTRLKTSNINQLIITILPAFRQINYYLPNVFYQKAGDLPRSPDLEQRPANQNYSKLSYGVQARYVYDAWQVLYTEPYSYELFNRVSSTVMDAVGSNDTSFKIVWSTNDGNPITKTSFYPTTNYNIATPPVPSTFSITITSNQVEFNLYNFCRENGWEGTRPVSVTIASGVYIYSSNRSIPALTISGTFPNGVTLINNGFIVGRGGNGHTYTNSGRVLAQSGGTAIAIITNGVTIQNNSIIAGGGGGGGSIITTAYGIVQATISPGGGGGAGGGNGGNGRDTYYGYPDAPGGFGGSPGNTGSNGSFSVWYDYYSTYGSVGGGGGGGRVFPGTGGAGGQGSPSSLENSFGRGGGAGGGGGAYITSAGANALGGAGGSTNSVGITATSVNGFVGGGGGGGWGASGGGPGTPGSGGAAVTQSGYTVTWTSVGTRYGAIVT